MNLYINSCVRPESRTNRIAKALLEKLGGDFVELDLEKEGLVPLTNERLEKRSRLIEAGDYSDPMFDCAKQFAAADKIVISAPFWDLSFPSSLKVYFENIYAIGIVSRYSPEGIPVGMCRASDLYYVTTAGGPLACDFGFEYVKALAAQCFGIREVHLIKAEMLDVVGFDAEKTVSETVKNIEV